MKYALSIIAIIYCFSLSCKKKEDASVIPPVKDSTITVASNDSIKIIDYYYYGETYHVKHAGTENSDSTYADTIRLRLLYHTITKDSSYQFYGKPFNGSFQVNDSGLYQIAIKPGSNVYNEQTFTTKGNILFAAWNYGYTDRNEYEKYTFNGAK